MAGNQSVRGDIQKALSEVAVRQVKTRPANANGMQVRRSGSTAYGPRVNDPWSHTFSPNDVVSNVSKARGGR